MVNRIHDASLDPRPHFPLLHLGKWPVKEANMMHAVVDSSANLSKLRFSICITI